jgi:chromatin remodeling complex protein RSC6
MCSCRCACLQDPKDKRSIIPDAKLSTIITPPVTMFSMNKQISRHVFNKGAGTVHLDTECSGILNTTGLSGRHLMSLYS